jgi:hypothetical protein
MTNWSQPWRAQPSSNSRSVVDRLLASVVVEQQPVLQPRQNRALTASLAFVGF